MKNASHSSVARFGGTWVFLRCIGADNTVFLRKNTEMH